MSGGDLMRSATLIKGKLRPQMESDFRLATADVQGIPGYESMIKTARGRLKLLKKEAETINIKAEMDRHPWAVAAQNIADFKKAIGESIAGPMASISRIVAGIAKAMKEVPGLAGLVGWGAILVSVAGAASLLISVFTPLYSVLSKLGVITRLLSAYEWASLTIKQAWFAATTKQTIALVTLTGATEAEAVSVIGSNAATSMGIGARLRLAAANIYNTVATKASTVAHWAAAGVQWALVAVTNVLATVYGLLTGRITLTTITTKAMSAATMISRVVMVAASVVMATLSAIYGLLTGRIALMTVATGASTAAMVITGAASAATTATLGIMSAASIVATGGFTALATAIWAALSPLLPFIAAGALIVGILGLVTAKAGILGPLLKGLGSINLGKVFKDLGKGDLGKAWHDLTKGFKLPSLSKIWDNLNIGGIIQGMGKGPQEILQTIADHMRIMLRWISTNIAPVTDKIHEILKKVYSVFDWVYSLFQRFWNWIQQAIPGAAKETKRQEIDKLIAKENKADKTKSLSFNRNTGKYSVTDLTVSSGTSHYLSEKDYGEGVYNKLTKKGAEYMALPGFAEGIAQAVAKGISGIGDTIASAIVKALEDKLGIELKLPESLTNILDKLNTTLTGLRTWLKDHGIGDSDVETPNGGYESDEFKATKKSNGRYDIIYKNPGIFGPSMDLDLTEEQVQEKLKDATNVKQVTTPAQNAASGSSVDTNLNAKAEHGYRLISDPETKITEYQYNNYLDESQKSSWEPYAVGATFKTGGLFAGKVHDTEEITPQAITKRGPGPIAKAIDLLHNVTNKNGVSSSASSGLSSEVHVHMPTQDFSGMKISSDVDFERILKDANKKAVADAVSEIKRMIGQDR
jgi:hypothetical protein